MLLLLYLSTGLQTPLPPLQQRLLTPLRLQHRLHALHMDEGRKDASPDEEQPARQQQQTDERDMGDKLNEMLDRPFFDPAKAGSKDEPGLLQDFRRQFDEDPEMASTLFVGLYFALLLVFAQQGVRIYKHCYFAPDKLCPWDVTPSFDALMNF